MKKFLALVLDLFLGILGTGWLLTRLSGGTKTFELYNTWFLIWIITVILYFTLLKKYLGQSLAQKLLKIKPTKK